MVDESFLLMRGAAMRGRQPGGSLAAAPGQKRITISIIDLQPDSNRILKQYIETSSWLKLGCWCRPGKESLQAVEQVSSEALLVDAKVIDAYAGSYIRDLKRKWHPPTVIMFGCPLDFIGCIRCFQAGADGVFEIASTRDSFEATIHSALNGWKPTPPEIHRLLVERFICASFCNGPAKNLTMSEREVMSCFSLGYIDKDIATARGTSERTINAITNSIYRKLGVHSRRDALDMCLGFLALGTNNATGGSNSNRS